jgi:hypothetical protein
MYQASELLLALLLLLLAINVLLVVISILIFPFKEDVLAQDSGAVERKFSF